HFALPLSYSPGHVHSPTSRLPCPPVSPTLFPYTTLFRSSAACFTPGPGTSPKRGLPTGLKSPAATRRAAGDFNPDGKPRFGDVRSEEHTSELQSLRHLVCRLLLEKKKTIQHDVWILSHTA